MEYFDYVFPRLCIKDWKFKQTVQPPKTNSRFRYHIVLLKSIDIDFHNIIFVFSLPFLLPFKTMRVYFDLRVLPLKIYHSLFELFFHKT